MNTDRVAEDGATTRWLATNGSVADRSLQDIDSGSASNNARTRHDPAADRGL